MNSNKQKYIAFLRGINVGGHHKVPMAELREEMGKLKFENVVTLLNSGNIIFDAEIKKTNLLEKSISEHLGKVFGFPIPIMVRKAETIQSLFKKNPFSGNELSKETRFYISLLREDIQPNFKAPWTSDDGSFKIIEKTNKNILSILDLSKTKTPKAMAMLEKTFGKDITTRNWKTIEKIEKKLKA